MLDPLRMPWAAQPIRSATASEASRTASRAASTAWRQLAEAATLATAAARWTRRLRRDPAGSRGRSGRACSQPLVGRPQPHPGRQAGQEVDHDQQQARQLGRQVAVHPPDRRSQEAS